MYKTPEIPDDLWINIVNGFNESFNLNKCVDDFKNSFCRRNKLGYGFHAVAFSEDGEVAGFHTQSPTFYKGDLNVVVAGSSYVRKKYRQDIFIFYEMSRKLAEYCRNEGFSVKVGVPNHNSFEYSLKILKSKYVADLDYYMIPFHLSTCLHKPALRWFDGVINFGAQVHLIFQMFVSKIFNFKEKSVKYELDISQDFFKTRFPEPYKKVQFGNVSAYYRVYDEDGVKTVYLLDFREKSRRTSWALAKAVKQIANVEAPDAILFVGWLRLCQLSLLKVPKSLVPKRLPLTFYILDKSEKSKFADMSNKRNWNFSLMNFDVR